MQHTEIELGERQRLLAMSVYEQELAGKGFFHIAGVDEVGRGPLAGPVVAAACILPANYLLPQINDSKKLTPRLRDLLYQKLTSDPQVCYSIAIIEPEIIDRINIFQASLLAMQRAVESLPKKPDYLLIDGKHAPSCSIIYETLISGDSLSISIAAASIIAKVHRDSLMEGYHHIYPEYGFAAHKGYATSKHLEALEKFGPLPIHRKSFSPIKKYLYTFSD